ncbi:sigma-54 dependent transcriptional regulator [Alphaproteobacteria bacterium]|jgi:two-component system nitrogen regulation response regulator NtrX|nr:sigma-54 dependent transcriptional regulator [Alphaproteobacteria bacterium]
MVGDILIVDDERDIRSLIGMTLKDEGYSTQEAANAKDARDMLAAQPPSLAILDIWMRDSDMDGIELLEWVKSIYPDLPVLMISGHGTIETAVQAIRQGAYDFIEKPFKEDRLLLMVERALQTSRLARENAELRARVSEEGEPEIIGQSQAIRALQTAITRIAPTASRVLINGPNGSGKELAARVIHHKSTRRDARFVVANCARLAPERVDSELFGAESMQSNRRIVGLFEQAHKGTLYFDEICDLPLETQGKIVRAITEQRFRRVGGNAEVVVDVRVISASSRDLASKISDGSLREDLYYRLGVVPLIMPPLTERRDDIPRLAKYFAKTVARRLGRQPLKFSDEVFAAMQGYDWPGNVRQMLNTVENMLIMAPPGSNEPVSLDALPREIQNISQAGINSDMEGFWALPLRGAREEFERAYMAAQLGRFGGNISRMAVFVGMERSALHRKLKSLGVESDG